jgi:hypothetical protein
MVRPHRAGIVSLFVNLCDVVSICSGFYVTGAVFANKVGSHTKFIHHQTPLASMYTIGPNSVISKLKRRIQYFCGHRKLMERVMGIEPT